MKYILKAYTIFETGKRVDKEGNPHQEDAIFPAHMQSSPTDRLFIVCDGMGGHDAGEVASNTVCAAISDTILTESTLEGEFDIQVLNRSIDNAFDALELHDNVNAKKKMGTTLAMLKLCNNGAVVAHMGDSRVYHIRPGVNAHSTRIMFETRDHSLVNQLVDIGELKPEEARNYPHRNVITRALQPHPDRRTSPDVHLIEDIRPGDYFYLCSDGMLENMEDEQIKYSFSGAAGDDNSKVFKLLTATKQNRDNHSAIIVHILDVLNDDGSPMIFAPDVNDSNDDVSKIVAIDYQNLYPVNSASGASGDADTGIDVSADMYDKNGKRITPGARAVNKKVNKDKNNNTRRLGYTVIALLLLMIIALGAYIYWDRTHAGASADEQPLIEDTRPDQSDQPADETTAPETSKDHIRGAAPKASNRNRAPRTEQRQPQTEQSRPAAPSRQNAPSGPNTSSNKSGGGSNGNGPNTSPRYNRPDGTAPGGTTTETPKPDSGSGSGSSGSGSGNDTPAKPETSPVDPNDPTIGGSI